jgi:FtsP/CotA-like multicopper oxidase with cupredoxin domain
MTPADSDGKGHQDFWTINKRAWEGMSADNLPQPLATLQLGQSYIFDFHNATPHEHPIHLHGFTFTVLSSDKRDIVPYHTDTVLLEKYERARIAFVADNPGRWMYHCHVIEHMKTGLMGYIEVI